MPSKIVKETNLDRSHALQFKQLLQEYETKEYRKGIKTADSILQKYPDHGETMAMKGLILTNIDKKEEGWECVRKGLRKDLKSHICWHVYGLLYRAEKNYEESMKCYLNAAKFDPQNLVVLRDLAVMQSQLRIFPGLIETRKKLLAAQPDVGGHHTALAVAHHLDGDFLNAEKVLQNYEAKLLIKPKNNFEHSSMLLYHNSIVAASGSMDKALQHLTEAEPQILDKLQVLERRAAYELRLKHYKESELLYRQLLDLNPDCHRYYAGLEQALGLYGTDSVVAVEMVEQAASVYAQLQVTFQEATAPWRRPLEWLSDQPFRTAIDQYLRRSFQKGVPSTFVNIKALYRDPAKANVIEDVVETYLNEFQDDQDGQGEFQTNGINRAASSVREAPTTYLWVLYFLAQSSDHRRRLNRAMSYIDKALRHTPTLVELHLTKARILKHAGSPVDAADQMNIARELDLQDRFINTKTTKYYLKADMNIEALNTISLFVNSTLGGGAIGDLQEMQSIKFILEDGLSYARQSLLGLALKRFQSVKWAIDQWYEDQFDFHQYCFRKGTIDSYVETLRWEDSIYSHRIYRTAAVAAVRTLLRLQRDPRLKQGPINIFEGSESDHKKEKKRIQKIRAARARDATRLAEKKDGIDMHRKVDSDPLGDQLIATKTPLQDAERYLAPWLHADPANSEALLLQAELHIEQSRLNEAVEILQEISDSRKCHMLQYMLHLHSGSGASERVQAYLETTTITSQSLVAWNEAFLTSANSTDEFLIGLRISCDLKEDITSKVMQFDLDLVRTTLEQAREMLYMVETSCPSTADQFRNKIKSVWTLAKVDCK